MLAHTIASSWLTPSLCLKRLMAGLLLAGSCSAATLPFYDDFEGGLGNWSPGGSWGLTTARYASPSHAATDSPGSFYTNNANSALALAVPITLTGAVRPALSFQHQHALETGYDFGLVEVSVDGGSTWILPALASYTGNLGAMTREQLDLSSYAGSGELPPPLPAGHRQFRVDGWLVCGRCADRRSARARDAGRNSHQSQFRRPLLDGIRRPGLCRLSPLPLATPGVDWRTARVVAEISPCRHHHRHGSNGLPQDPPITIAWQ